MLKRDAKLSSGTSTSTEAPPTTCAPGGDCSEAVLASYTMYPRRAGRGALPRMRTAWRLALPAKAGRAAARAGGSGADARRRQTTRRRARRQKRRVSASRVTLRADHAPDIGCSGSPSCRTAPRPPTRRRRARRCGPRAGAAARRATAPLARDATAASRHVRARRSARHAARCSRAAAATAARRRPTRGRVGFSFALSVC